MDEAFLYEGSGQNMLYSISTHLDKGTRKKIRPYTFKLMIRIKNFRDHEIYWILNFDFHLNYHLKKTKACDSWSYFSTSGSLRMLRDGARRK